ncbi:MAG: DUF2285 domain-containing protein [Rhodospirillaceae bacterium]|nr:MAG: DUF2285 domain-containing protein [Rhodospirillaceae bacterium]
MAPVELDPVIADEVPWAPTLTAYDEAHLIVYLRLIDARAAGATDDDIARIVLKIDPAQEPERAKVVLETHMSRVRWLTEHGYKELLKR